MKKRQKRARPQQGRPKEKTNRQKERIEYQKLVANAKRQRALDRRLTILRAEREIAQGGASHG